VQVGPVWAALIGYALGTLQTLFVDFVRNRGTHARQLRLLRADLRNAATFSHKYELTPTQLPKHDLIPRPPSVSATFLSTLSATDFTLTDEHDDDNTQQSLLALSDNFAAMDHYVRQVKQDADAVGEGLEVEKAVETWHRMVRSAQQYDKLVDQNMFLIDEAIRDLDRRIADASWWRQIKRRLLPLPRGYNPPALAPDDPRVKSFARNRERLKKD
jgi:hypothetical protein